MLAKSESGVMHSTWLQGMHLSGTTGLQGSPGGRPSTMCERRCQPAPRSGAQHGGQAPEGGAHSRTKPRESKELPTTASPLDTGETITISNLNRVCTENQIPQLNLNIHSHCRPVPSQPAPKNSMYISKTI